MVLLFEAQSKGPIWARHKGGFIEKSTTGSDRFNGWIFSNQTLVTKLYWLSSRGVRKLQKDLLRRQKQNAIDFFRMNRLFKKLKCCLMNTPFCEK